MHRSKLRTLFGPIWAGKLTLCRFEGEGGSDDGGGAGEVHWLDSNENYADLAKDEGARKTLSTYKTEKDAHKALVESKRHIMQSFRVPDKLDGMDEAEVAKITGRLKGILKPEHVRSLIDAPDKPEGYELVRPKMPDGLTYDEQHETDLRAFGVKHGLTKAAMTELYALEVGRDSTRFTTEIQELDKLWDGIAKQMIDRHGQEEWTRRQNLVKQLLGEWGNKAGFKSEDVVAGLLEIRDATKLTPLIAAVAELAVVAQAEGVTKIGSAAGGGSETINVKERWPNSAQFME